jgi:hypothetical protein
MASVLEKNIGPISFLMDDASKISGIVKPRCGRHERKSLYTAKCSVLVGTKISRILSPIRAVNLA